MKEKKFIHKVAKFYKNLDDDLKLTVPNETIYRLLGNYKFQFKKKKILDIGIGNGDNILEFRRRGAEVFGIDIRKNLINKIVRNNNLKKKNFFPIDLNKSFPDLNIGIDLCNFKDTIYYLDANSQFRVFENIHKILKKNGLFLFQYIQTELLVKKHSHFSYFINNGMKKQIQYHEKGNPVKFLKEKHIKKLIKKFKVLNSIFDIDTQIRKKKKIITINRYFLLQK